MKIINTNLLFSAASIGVIIEWILNGLEESEEEMANNFIDLLYGYMDNYKKLSI